MSKEKINKIEFNRKLYECLQHLILIRAYGQI